MPVVEDDRIYDADEESRYDPNRAPHPDNDPDLSEEDRKREIDELEDLYNSGTDSGELNLADSEDRAAEQLSIDDDDAEARALRELDDGVNFYDAENDRYGKRMGLKFSFGKKRRRIAMLLLAGSGIAGFLGFSFLSGPLQLLQIGNFLKSFHFADQENITENRMGKISRYIRYRDTPQNTRLGYFGNKYANRVETKMNDAGIKSRYNADSRGALAGYDLDTSKFDDPELKRLAEDLKTSAPEDLDANQAKVKDHIKKTYGLDVDSIDIDSGRISTNTNSGYFSNKKIMKTFYKKAGYSGTLGGLRSRLGLRRAGVDLHPIKKIDNKINQKQADLIKAIKDRRRERIKNGSTSATPRTITPDSEVDSEGNRVVDPNAAATATEANSYNEIGNSPDPPDVKKGAIRGKIAKASGIAGVGAIVCAVKGIADNLDEIAHARVVLPLARFAGEFIAISSQIMGSIALGKPVDLDLTQMQVVSETLYSKENGSWFASTEVQAAVGNDAGGREIPPEARIDPDGNAVSKFLDAIPGLNTLCDVLNSFWGNLVVQTVGFALGPVGFLVGEVAGRIFGPPVINGVINMLAAEEIDLEVAGAPVGSYGMHGGRHGANMAFIASGATKQSDAKMAEWDSIRDQELTEKYASANIFEKFLNPIDIRTPLGSTIAQTSSDPIENISILAKTGAKSIASLHSTFGNMLTGKAKAASIEHDYGFSRYSFSLEELEDPRYEIPQENTKLALEILNGPNGSTYIKRAKDCFGLVIDGSGNIKSESQTPSYASIEKNGGGSCGEEGGDWGRVRFYIFDNLLSGAATCYEGDNETEACGEVGLEAANPFTNGTSTSGDFITDAGGLNCSGFKKLTSTPANIVNGEPTNATLVPYPSDIQSACEQLKVGCLEGVAGTIKALCSAFEFSDVWYGNGYSPNTQKKYGFPINTVILWNPAKWFELRKPGLNADNLLECSGLTTAAVYRAFGYTGVVGTSGNWGSLAHPDLFRQITEAEILPGDFLSFTRSGSGHIAIAAGTVDPNRDILVFHTSSPGTTAHFKKYNMKSFEKGNLSRWIGPGI